MTIYEVGADARITSPSCERNKAHILEVLRRVLPDSGRVLEIASGTGQHAAYFGVAFENLEWQPTDVNPETDSIVAWADFEGASNPAPLVFDLFHKCPVDSADALVCINAIHIAPWPATERLFEHAAAILKPSGRVILYGPFEYEGQPLEASNVKFNEWLKGRSPESGIRAFEDVQRIANRLGFVLHLDQEMPANNHILVWEFEGK